MLLSFSHLVSIFPSLSIYFFFTFCWFYSRLLGHFQTHWLTVDFVVFSWALAPSLSRCRSNLRHTFSVLHFSLSFLFLRAFGLFTFSRSNSPLVQQLLSSKILSQLQTRTHIKRAFLPSFSFSSSSSSSPPPSIRLHPYYSMCPQVLCSAPSFLSPSSVSFAFNALLLWMPACSLCHINLV